MYGTHRRSFAHVGRRHIHIRNTTTTSSSSVSPTLFKRRNGRDAIFAIMLSSSSSRLRLRLRFGHGQHIRRRRDIHFEGGHPHIGHCARRIAFGVDGERGFGVRVIGTLRKKLLMMLTHIGPNIDVVVIVIVIVVIILVHSVVIIHHHWHHIHTLRLNTSAAHSLVLASTARREIKRKISTLTMRVSSLVVGRVRLRRRRCQHGWL
mmetsp:Transcript_19697/g.31339  ORF Transcript_19697/g.31339 Transcript_19697/m.31339 type:complete len:206 (-) Transcript_19697:936-1553(-)